MENAYVSSPEAVLQRFQVAESSGLSDEQVSQSRDKHGRNGTWLLNVAQIERLHILTDMGNSNPRRPSYALMATST